MVEDTSWDFDNRMYCKQFSRALREFEECFKTLHAALLWCVPYVARYMFGVLCPHDLILCTILIFLQLLLTKILPNLKHLNLRPAFRQFRKPRSFSQQWQEIFAPAIRKHEIIAREMLEELCDPCTRVNDGAGEGCCGGEGHLKELICATIGDRHEGIVDAGRIAHVGIPVHEQREEKPLGIEDARARGNCGKRCRVRKYTVGSSGV